MVSEELKREYWKVIRRTRPSGRISPGLVSRTEEQWKAFDEDVVAEALRVHIVQHKSEKECYTLGIMRNLQKQKDKGKWEGGTA